VQEAVFSSSVDEARATGVSHAGVGVTIAPWLNRAPRSPADGAFSFLAPSGCRIEGKLRVGASRLPVGQTRRDSVVPDSAVPMEGNLRPIWGERMATSARVEVEPGRGRDILPLDDVYTSGTTVSGRARVLRRAGAACVYAATLARALKADRIGVQREVREAA
jgi:hypothetical protein